ncbi:hypothetical protein 000TH008_246 [Bacillus phage 000TH008]|nr:hypothetical protein 000TH008_246 [Bacillus phage 000TH008]QQO40939.1 hypothetical protein 000TH009_246 [Bacillus phage 000TH009]
MKKVGISVEEIIHYTSEIFVERPDDMSDDQFEDILDYAERECRDADGNVTDIVFYLEEAGLKVTEYAESFPHSPSRSEIAIEDVWEDED